MVLGIVLVFLIGGVTGVAIETNTPAVSDFGDKYLAGPQDAGKK